MTIASQLAPTGTLRVAVWMVPYFARIGPGGLGGIVPDLAAELAQRAGTKLDLVKFENPARIIAAFRDGSLDVTFLGITAERAEAIDFGPVVFEIQTTYLVPADSTIENIAEIDRAGVRIAVPAKSAQEAHLTKTIAAATLLPVPAETPQRAIDMLKAGEADAFSPRRADAGGGAGQPAGRAAAAGQLFQRADRDRRGEGAPRRRRRLRADLCRASEAFRIVAAVHRAPWRHRRDGWNLTAPGRKYWQVEICHGRGSPWLRGISRGRAGLRPSHCQYLRLIPARGSID